MQTEHEFSRSGEAARGRRTNAAEAGLKLAAGLAVLALAGCAPADSPEVDDASSVVDEGGLLSSGGLTLVPMTDSPSFEGAALELHGIDQGSNLEPGPTSMHFAVTNYELGVQTPDAVGKGIANSGDGQHIHLILNNGPYSAHYEESVEVEFTPGYYVMLAFLSRSYHESVKSPGAAVVTDFTVGGEPSAEVDFTAPHLFYSRPKGTYKGADIERLMLDFYLVNADLSADGYKVRATINGNEFLLTRWVPYLIEGLEPGTVTIQLELLDSAGNWVEGPFNRVTRTATLEGDSSAE
jgi:hypothetical protein